MPRDRLCGVSLARSSGFPSQRTAGAILALVVTLNATSGAQVQETAALLPAADCLAAMRSIWDVPADTVGKDHIGNVPAMDAACTWPSDAPAIGDVWIYTGE